MKQCDKDTLVDVLVLFCCFADEGANGGTGREWKKLVPELNSRLGNDWNVIFLTL